MRCSGAAFQWRWIFRGADCRDAVFLFGWLFRMGLSGYNGLVPAVYKRFIICELSGCKMETVRERYSCCSVFRIGVVWVRVPVPERSILSGLRFMLRVPSFHRYPDFPRTCFLSGAAGRFPAASLPLLRHPLPASFPPFLPLFSRRGSLRCRNLPGEQLPAPFHSVHIGRHAVLDPRNGRRHALHRRSVAGVERLV